MPSTSSDLEGRPGRRAAAKKASHMSARQLEISPVRSGDEADGPLFGEPLRKKAPIIKRTYGKKTKSPKSSPGKYSDISSVSREISRPSAFAGSSSPIRPRPSVRKTMARKKRASKRPQPEGDDADDLSSLSSLTDSEGSHGSDIEAEELPPLSQEPQKRVMERTWSSPVLGTRQQRASLKRKRKVSPDPSDSDSLTDLWPDSRQPQSSPPPETERKKAGVSIFGRNPRPFPFRARPRADTLPSVPTKLVNTPSASTIAAAVDEDAVHPGWKLEDHELAFVRVNPTGEVCESEEGLWWPANVLETEPVRVVLFGKYPGYSPKAPERQLTIDPPIPETIRPFCAAPRQLRFTEQTYHSTDVPFDDVQSSPRKKQRTARADLDSRWTEAKGLMLLEYQNRNDDMPLTLGSRVRRGSSGDSPFLKNRNGLRAPNVEKSESSDADDLWEPEESPYDVPGELVLARDGRKSSDYWPAKLMRYEPPKARGQKAKYKVLFFNGESKVLPDDSDMFYNELHPNFKTCKLGATVDNYGLNEGANDEDNTPNDHIMIPQDHLSDDLNSLRATSPIPETPAPTAFAFELSIEAQFEYVKPVLRAILSGTFEPAKHKHIQFMKGGKQRNAVTDAAWKRGEVTHQEKEELIVCIRRWMHRRQRKQALGIAPPDPCVRLDSGSSDNLTTDQKQEVSLTQVDGQSDESTLTELSDNLSLAGQTERAASSEAEGPPSSFVTTENVQEVSDAEVDAPLDNTAPTDAIDINPDADFERAGLANGNEQTNQLTLPQPTSDTPTANRTPESQPGTLPTYAMLSELDQITYCTSVLLPEAIIQLLLWRNGLRTSPELLPADEERKLHRLGEQQASATYWVHDIINLKRAAEGKLLPSYAPLDQETEVGRNRLRPRRK